MSERSEAATMLWYFHSEKGDMTRYVGYDKAITMFPDIAKAKADADYYNKVLDLIVERTSDDNHE